MSLKSAEFEVVDYKAHSIGHVTGRLIYNFAQYSGIVGTQSWAAMQFQLLTLIRDQVPYRVIYNASGMEILFSGYLEPRPVIKDGQIIYQSPEPSCAFFEQPRDVSPTMRSHIGRVTASIVQEMEEVYHLHTEKDPLVLRFPKSIYSKKIERFKIAMIEPVPTSVPQIFKDAFKE